MPLGDAKGDWDREKPSAVDAAGHEDFADRRFVRNRKIMLRENAR
jgi:hypothetical protein